jgi:hypothetical protein
MVQNTHQHKAIARGAHKNSWIILKKREKTPKSSYQKEGRKKRLLQLTITS